MSSNVPKRPFQKIEQDPRKVPTTKNRAFVSKIAMGYGSRPLVTSFAMNNPKICIFSKPNIECSLEYLILFAKGGVLL